MDFPKIMKPTNIVCKECVRAKKKKSYVPSKKFTTTKKLEIVHTYLSGPTKTRGFYGETYFMIIVDNFTRMMWVAFFREKYRVFEKFNFFKNKFENESLLKITYLRFDRGGKFTLNEFNIFL